MSPQSVIPPSSTRFQKNTSRFPKLNGLIGTLQTDLNLSTSLLIGATLQTILVLVLPKRYALTPAIFLLAVVAIDTFLVTKGYKRNPYSKDILIGKTSAQVPDGSGTYNGPGDEKIAVLLLGAKANHPMGMFAPGFVTMAGFLREMVRHLEDPSTAADSGFLGQTGFTRKDENGATHNLLITYWRSIDHVHRFAHAPIHTKAWRWWDKTLREHGHLGIMHEVFEAPRGMWEAMYVNFQPTMLGATTYLKRTDASGNEKIEAGTIEGKWISGLLDANKGMLRTSNGRRGLKGQHADFDKFGVNVYAQQIEV